MARPAAGRGGSPVDEQAPNLLERDLADKILDVHAPVAKRAAFLVGLRDLGREGDNAFEAGFYVREVWSRGGGGAHAYQDTTARNGTCSWYSRAMSFRTSIMASVAGEQ